jgi:hypothetical protein
LATDFSNCVQWLQSILSSLCSVCKIKWDAENGFPRTESNQPIDNFLIAYMQNS